MPQPKQLPRSTARPPITASIYLITDEQTALRPDLLREALDALPAGSAAVQLRAKSFGARQLLDAALALVPITRARGAALYINERVDVAIASGASGVHLPATGLPPSVVRRISPELRIGASTHSIGEARAAFEGGADFVTFGPVWATPSKIALGAPVGISLLADAARSFGGPVYALGGVDLGRAAECASVGARVACVRAVLGAADVGAAARAMHDAATQQARRPA